MLHRRVQPIDDLHRQDRRQELMPPVVVGRRAHLRHQHSGLRIAPQLAPRCDQGLGHRRQQPFRPRPIDQQGLCRSAHGHPPHLGVDDHVARHPEFGRGVQIGVVDPLQVAQNRDPRFGLHPGDQALAATRDQKVDRSFQPGQQRPDRRPVRRVDQLHRVGRQPRRRQPLDHRRMDRQRTVEAIRSAAQDGDIARADAQGRRVGGHIGPALVDDGQHADGRPHPGEIQPVRPGPACGFDA